MFSAFTILLVEDNPGDVFIIRKMLEDNLPGVKIVAVETLEESLDLLKARSFSAILLDLTLPDSMGLESISLLRDRGAHAPIIVLTGVSDRMLALQALKAGAQDYLLKDQTSSSMLERSIRYAIERHQFESRIHRAESDHRRFMESQRDTLKALTSTLDLDEVLTRILENLGQVVTHDAANIALLEGSQARVVRSRNGAGDIRSTGETFGVSSVPIVRDILADGEPAEGQLTDFPCMAMGEDVHGSIGYMGAPIVLRDQVLGILNIFRFDDGGFSTEDLDRLKIFAEHAAIAIQNANLYKTSREIAAVEERQRLARDLHDSVSQALFSASVISEFGMREAQTNPVRVLEMWTTLHDLIVGALAEMRMLLLELRPANLAQATLRDLLTYLTSSVRARKALAMEAEVSEVDGIAAEAKIGLYRIAQEALNNIVKHSDASHVRCQLSAQNGVVEMTITDDGVGFDLSSVGATSLGLSIMRERASEIGAELCIESAPKAGTSIQVRYYREAEFEGAVHV
jgi:signal transduction histidine kinase